MNSVYVSQTKDFHPGDWGSCSVRILFRLSISSDLIRLFKLMFLVRFSKRSWFGQPDLYSDGWLSWLRQMAVFFTISWVVLAPKLWKASCFPLLQQIMWTSILVVWNFEVVKNKQKRHILSKRLFRLPQKTTWPSLFFFFLSNSYCKYLV